MRASATRPTTTAHFSCLMPGLLSLMADIVIGTGAAPHSGGRLRQILPCFRRDDAATLAVERSGRVVLPRLDAGGAGEQAPGTLGVERSHQQGDLARPA